MHHIASRIFATGTWFTTFLYFVRDYLNADFIFSSIISMSSLTLLLLQIYNQYQIYKKNKNK